MQRIDSTEQKLVVLLMNKQSKFVSENNDLKEIIEEKKIIVLLSVYVIYLWIIRVSRKKVKTFSKQRPFLKRKISLIWNLISAWILENVLESEGGAT